MFKHRIQNIVRSLCKVVLSVKKKLLSALIERNNSYGRKGQVWHSSFINYMEQIASHPNYAGMPDAFKSDGVIQWEAPSNRKSGVYKDTHIKRLTWWRNKAQEIGVDISLKSWISKTAKLIHPYKQKPCKRCGKWMKLGYVYPNQKFSKKLNEFLDYDFHSMTDIFTIVKNIHSKYGERSFDILTRLFNPPLDRFSFATPISDWIEWLEQEYIPSEPSTLSPGAMSNAPDRFDGFHSFNLCCRSKADSGREQQNLKSYSTDRRVFEYWSDGNWIAADRLMGKIRAEFGEQKCRNIHDGPCDADHIGPLSLGFSHIPCFQLLCSNCNSSKNNRLSLSDVRLLRQLEDSGQSVCSWYAESLWNRLKEKIVDEETSLRASKILRDNQRFDIELFAILFERGHLTLLLNFLNLQFADYDYHFKNLRIENALTVYDSITKTPRLNKYVLGQKLRKIRIAFAVLREYSKKENRHKFLTMGTAIQKKIDNLVAKLRDSEVNVQALNVRLQEVISSKGSPDVRNILNDANQIQSHVLKVAHATLLDIFSSAAAELAEQWDNDRYKRTAMQQDHLMSDSNQAQ